jgi:hypothetical protein
VKQSKSYLVAVLGFALTSVFLLSGCLSQTPAQKDCSSVANALSPHTENMRSIYSDRDPGIWNTVGIESWVPKITAEEINDLYSSLIENAIEDVKQPFSDSVANLKTIKLSPNSTLKSYALQLAKSMPEYVATFKSIYDKYPNTEWSTHPIVDSDAHTLFDALQALNHPIEAINVFCENVKAPAHIPLWAAENQTAATDRQIKADKDIAVLLKEVDKNIKENIKELNSRGQSDKGLTLVKIKFNNTSYGSGEAKGTIENGTGGFVSTADVTVNILDSNGNIVNQLLGSIENVASGQQSFIDLTTPTPIPSKFTYTFNVSVVLH